MSNRATDVALDLDEVTGKWKAIDLDSDGQRPKRGILAWVTDGPDNISRIYCLPFVGAVHRPGTC